MNILTPKDQTAEIFPENSMQEETIATIENGKENFPFPETLLEEKMLSKEDKELLQQQWNIYNRLKGVQIINNLKLRMEAGLPVLTKGTLVHGTSILSETEENALNISKIKSFAENGVLSGEFLGIPEDLETNYCADFYKVPENMSIQEYSDYINTKIKLGVVPLSSPESFKLPSKKSSSEIAIIINTHNKDIQDLTQYDAYNAWGFSKMKNIVNEKGLLRGPRYDGKMSAILGGIPANFISGLIVGSKLLQIQPDTIRILRENFGKEVIIFDEMGNIL
ncbi:hypothetical protein CSB09_04440 [Candidatus Gracilibacteria bacterium]|nr:MAG: hypothetical protein CSB09_04440 [Candidatus Gracilibacteria bacterium]